MKPFAVLLIIIFMLLLSHALFSQNLLMEHSIKYVDPNKAVLVGEDGLSLKTTDGGATWTETPTGITNVLFGNDVLDENTSLAVGENGVILKTTNSGANWELKESGTLSNLYDVEIINSTDAIACGDDGILLVSRNMGDTWEQVYTQPGVILNDVAFFDPVTGYAVGSGGRILKTNDGGVSWTDLRPAIDNFNIKAIGIKNLDGLTVVGGEGKVFNSNDGGYTWTSISTNLVNISINDIIYFTRFDGILVGDNSTILKTDDGGETWNGVNIAFTLDLVDLNSVAFSSTTTGIIIGGEEMEMYTSDGGGTWLKSPPQTKIALAEGHMIKNPGNFPNPFNPSTKIRFELPEPGNISVKVFDINGREVADLFSGDVSQGVHEFVFDASSHSSGIYFYKINANINSITNIRTGKMLLIK